jgi:hypothetical protein
LAESRKQVIKQAAEKASNRRQTLSQQLNCQKCSGTLGTLHLRGPAKCFESKISPSFTCDLCYQVYAFESQKKRTRTSSTSCEICNSKQVYGSFNNYSEDQLLDNITISFTCSKCELLYQFCSECGGGGKLRTGKWRPIGLFEADRKTCNLPHIRIGSVAVNYKIYDIPRQLSDQCIEGIKDVYFDCMISLYAIPSTLETPRFQSSLGKVRDLVQINWHNYLSQPLQNNVGNNNTYLTVASIEKRQRNQGKGIHKKKEKEEIPWLARLAKDGIVASSAKSNQVQTVMAMETVESNINHAFVGFSIMEWMKEKGKI